MHMFLPLIIWCRLGYQDEFETWMLLEFCDRGSLHRAIERGRIASRAADGQLELVRPAPLLHCSWLDCQPLTTVIDKDEALLLASFRSYWLYLALCLLVLRALLHAVGAKTCFRALQWRQ